MAISVNYDTAQRLLSISIQGRFVYDRNSEFCDSYELYLNENLSSVVINLQEVSYIDSSGLAMLLFLKEKIGECTEIHLNLCSKPVMEILKLGNFSSLFKITPCKDIRE